jgi:hypothetical protein
MFTKTVLAAIFLVFTVVDSSAFFRCSEPDAPYCATSYGAFDDEYDFDRCKSDMESYQSEVEEFLGCLKRESEQTLSEYNDAVESFNRRARGD